MDKLHLYVNKTLCSVFSPFNTDSAVPVIGNVELGILIWDQFRVITNFDDDFCKEIQIINKVLFIEIEVDLYCYSSH